MLRRHQAAQSPFFRMLQSRPMAAKRNFENGRQHCFAPCGSSFVGIPTYL